MDLEWFRQGTATIGATLREVGEGVGVAAREVVEKSRSDVGTLAVKTADITVELELTAVAASSGIEGGFGQTAVRGIRIGGYETKEQARNRITITLNAVAIPDARPAIRWPWDRWKRAALEDFLDVVERMSMSVATERTRDLADPAPGDPRLLGAIAKQVAELLSRVEGSTKEEQEHNPLAAEIVRALGNLGEMITRDAGRDVQLRAAIITTAAVIAGYFKGVLSAGGVLAAT